jgi:outer membrane protein
MRTPQTLGAAAGCAFALSASAASAQDLATKAHDVFFRAGVAAVRFDSGADFVVAGQPAPGADLELSNATTGAVEIDYFVHRNVSISLTVGYPPVTHAEGLGQLAPLGRLGSVRFGTGVLQAKYHFSGLGAFQPWIGAGVTRMVIFKNKDGAVQNLDVEDHWGGAVQIGADYMLTPRVGVYGSVSKLFVHTNGTASLGPAPVTAKIDLDPTIWQGGLSLRF